jgi:Tol biopolymer transport system component
MSRIDGVDGKPGFGGMGTVGIAPGQGNSGGLGGWAVGGTPEFIPADLAMPLPKGSDFLLQMHFHLTGRPETEKSMVGIYFADKAPERVMNGIGLPALFGFGAGIDIPPGEQNYTIQDSLTLPVDVKVYGASAHAHYLAKEIKATATLPDGSIKPLIWIQDWDFNWQEQYTYKAPFTLPKGTRIDAMLRYDNSADNPRNPSNPPKRALFGEESSDEMGGVGLNLITVNKEDEPALQKVLAEGAQAAIRRGGADGTARRYLEHQAARRPPAIAPRSIITLVDRQGKAVQTVGELGSYSQPALSPDGTRVAAIRNDQGRVHVWVLDIATGKGTQITWDAVPHTSPVWSFDGKQIAYIANQNEVHRKASNGSGNEELIYKHPGPALFLTDWSVDGRLCFWSGDAIYALPVEGDRKPVALVSEPGARGGRFSPDGRYLAYSSNPSGAYATYVTALKNSAAKPLQVSKDPALGGISWRGDGKELYFMGLAGLAPNGILAVDLTLGPELQAGIPRQLFRPTGVNSPAQLSNIATRDGERFVLLAAPPAPPR